MQVAVVPLGMYPLLSCVFSKLKLDKDFPAHEEMYLLDKLVRIIQVELRFELSSAITIIMHV
jgi:hypothetical protein